MPIKYTIEERGRLVIATGIGIITGSDILEHINELGMDERYQSPMRKIVDYRGSKDLVISQVEAEEIATRKVRLGKFGGEICVFITPSDSTYGTARVHQALLGGSNVQSDVYRSLNEALDWIMAQPLKQHSGRPSQP